MPNWLKKLLKKQRRKWLRLVGVGYADILIRAGWTIAKEEDTNHNIGQVYLELLENDYE